AESPSARRRGARWRETLPSAAALPLVSLRAQGVFSHHRLQHVLVQAEIGDQLLQPPVLLAQLLHLLRLAHFHAAVLRLPGVDGVLGHALLARHILDFATRFHLLQNPDDRRLAVLTLAHPLPLPFVRNRTSFRTD